MIAKHFMSSATVSKPIGFAHVVDIAGAGGYQQNIAAFRPMRDEILKIEQPPVSAAVGVPQLAGPPREAVAVV
jgi:hypothetical protein